MQKTPQQTKKYHDPETELTCNLAHNVQVDVSVFSVNFNDFCSVLWVLLYFTWGGGRFFSDSVEYVYYL